MERRHPNLGRRRPMELLWKTRESHIW